MEHEGDETIEDDMLKHVHPTTSQYNYVSFWLAISTGVKQHWSHCKFIECITIYCDVICDWILVKSILYENTDYNTRENNIQPETSVSWLT